MRQISDIIRHLRTDFSAFELNESDVEKNPLRQFAKWMEQALEAEVNEPNAMTLATVNKKKQPDARIVLLRDVDKTGFTFFTNYQSRKGTQMADNKQACLNFFWPELQRQVRILGTIEKLSAKASDAYFKTRPRESQLGAWASDQSRELNDRHALVERLELLEKKFEGKAVVRPPHWGGYRLKPHHIEFWQGRPSRLHDRIIYERSRNSGKWRIFRLFP
ncbi:MAG TPA: pyridoxamine 5'-phosphate oxidase [Bacteroidia bacterium]|jgi:pyridoxamine 5'-phosphate oxidase|nr:pyridoxamine 5'-phosphate oxidase [Bacteroidota bacterium]MBL7950040.1 pyridoxamine 5'-phosphate oxidase [Bacteroidia bacterium]MBP6010332.1 pyridoxamine 5'-phosphate oxidase [Bacteroidia bacterium]MBP7270741.1 pyridoxamine 5'-phosphate oxidase [Bacteroidia bacterium]MBP7772661.1 pyridoxamine 5'-phosphate oxidase [Bacteroidia bacterium]